MACSVESASNLRRQRVGKCVAKPSSGSVRHEQQALLKTVKLIPIDPPYLAYLTANLVGYCHLGGAMLENGTRLLLIGYNGCIKNGLVRRHIR